MGGELSARQMVVAMCRSPLPESITTRIMKFCKICRRLSKAGSETMLCITHMATFSEKAVKMATLRAFPSTQALPTSSSGCMARSKAASMDMISSANWNVRMRTSEPKPG
eukprot:Lithocolla_globosa_v1_NODE_4261_length_1477_cov_2.820675.p3 type:complete len:110 gc:universal NODE_4261_length_1477_cov_2.820675:458-787(+)